MKEKNKKTSIEIFSAFRSQQEKSLLNWMMIVDGALLLATLILLFVSQEILQLEIIRWHNYWILFGGNILIVGFLFFSLKKD